MILIIFIYFTAAWMGKKEIVDILLSKGAEVNMKNNDGMTALHEGLLKLTNIF